MFGVPRYVQTSSEKAPLTAGMLATTRDLSAYFLQ